MLWNQPKYVLTICIIYNFAPKGGHYSFDLSICPSVSPSIHQSFHLKTLALVITILLVDGLTSYLNTTILGTMLSLCRIFMRPLILYDLDLESLKVLKTLTLVIIFLLMDGLTSFLETMILWTIPLPCHIIMWPWLLNDLEDQSPINFNIGHNVLVSG